MAFDPLITAHHHPLVVRAVMPCRWLEVSSRSTEDVLQEVLSQLEQPQHQGGCGDSGRFDKATQAALKRYVPKLKLFSDAGRVAAVLDWVAEAAAARKGGASRSKEPGLADGGVQSV